MEPYFGTYQTFETPSKPAAAVLLGADNMVGDIYEIDLEMDGLEHKAWLRSRFDQNVGYFDPEFSRTLSVYTAEGMTVKGILSYVAYTDEPDPGHYWGEAAVIAYDPNLGSEFDTFIHTLAALIGEGVRPYLDLNPIEVDHIIENEGNWTPKKTRPQPQKQKGTAILKTHRTLSDKMIEQGRQGNKGCYVGAWIFLLALVALILFGIYSCVF